MTSKIKFSKFIQKIQFHFNVNEVVTMKIYGMGPSRSFRVLWAAEEAGIDYEYVEMKVGSTEAGGTQHPDYLALNIHGKVPCIVDDGFVLNESAAIVNYFARKSEKNLIPQDPHLLARYDELCYFILCELEQPLWSVGKHKFALPEEYRVPELITKTTAYEFKKAQNMLLKLYSGQEFMVSDTFTMADVLVTHTVDWACAFKFTVAQELLEYASNIRSRDAYVKVQTAIMKSS
jgi:glutathione S-transferase